MKHIQMKMVKTLFINFGVEKHYLNKYLIYINNNLLYLVIIKSK